MFGKSRYSLAVLFVCVRRETTFSSFVAFSLLSHSRQQHAWSSFPISMCLFLAHVFPAANTVPIRTLLSLSKFENGKFFMFGDLSNSTCYRKRGEAKLYKLCESKSRESKFN